MHFPSLFFRYRCFMSVAIDGQEQRALRTAQVMRCAGVGRNPLRFYEEKGLIHAAARTQSGYRAYAPSVLDDLAFIKQAKAAGLSIGEISELVKISRSATTTCGSVSRAISLKVVEIDQLIEKFEARKAFLLTFLTACSAQPETARCLIQGAGFSPSACGAAPKQGSSGAPDVKQEERT